MTNPYGLIRKHFWLILIVAGLFYAYNSGLLTIFAGEKELQWKGLAWAYKDSNAASASATTEAISLRASSTGTGGSTTGSSVYVRNDFDLSRFSEVKLLMDASTSSYISGNSASGSGATSISLDNYEVLGLSSHAEERGGTNIPSDSDTLRAGATLKRKGETWEIYQNDILIKTIQNKNPQLKFLADTGGNYGGGSATLTVYATFTSNALSLAPSNAPAAPSLSSLISSITGWLKKILDAVPFLSIVGQQSPVLGSTQTYQASLTAPYALDAQYADGTYAVRYCNTALVKADGTILSETGFEACTDSYSKTFTVKLPNQAGQHAIIMVMAESKGTFTTTTAYGTETGQWTFAPYEIIAKDALDISTKAPIPGASDIPTKPSGNFLTNLFKTLFGWLPFFK